MNAPRVIADIGSNHNGDIERAKELISQAAWAGCWGVKFQLFKADRLYDKPIDGLEERELPPDWLPELAACAKKHRIKFGCTPFDLEALNIIAPYVDFIKISSFDIKRKDLLQASGQLAAEGNYPMIVSAGLATKDDLKWLVMNHPIGADLCIMHCVSNYPTLPEKAAIGRVGALRMMFGDMALIGYSDHTTEQNVCLAASIDGASFIEVHFDYDCKDGWESKHGHCWGAHEVSEMIDHFRDIEGYCRDTHMIQDFGLLADPETGLREAK